MLFVSNGCWRRRNAAYNDAMSMRSDHKALLFLAGIAALGATVRVARAVGTPAPPNAGALEHQMQAADSAKRSLAAKRSDKSRRPKTPTADPAQTAGIAQRTPANGRAAAHRDYKGRLDLDVATAAEIDSIPGVGPTLAKRIVADRMANGAFRELTALRRVRGVSLKLLAGMDSLVAFSGIYKPPQPADTVLKVKPPRKRR
jgi:DNA uptake protein ComE-like DNA-binding protein